MIFQVLGSTENREPRKYGVRRKTEELMNYAKDEVVEVSSLRHSFAFQTSIFTL